MTAGKLTPETGQTNAGQKGERKGGQHGGGRGWIPEDGGNGKTRRALVDILGAKVSVGVCLNQLEVF